jgi:hypothetical protein
MKGNTINCHKPLIGPVFWQGKPNYKKTFLPSEILLQFCQNNDRGDIMAVL